MVWPTMSGMSVERRDQVLTTRLSPRRFSSSTFFRRWSSTKGPLLSDLGTACSSSPLGSTPPHDVSVGVLALLARPSFRLAPRRRRVPASRGLALPTAQGVVDRVHRHSPNARPLPQPPAPARLADRDQLGLRVADLSDGGAAPHRDEPYLPRGKAQAGHGALLGHDLDRSAGGAGDLGAAALLQLHIMNHGSHRDVPQRQRVARTDLGAGP